MPRPFTDDERDRIRRQLLDAARAQFSRLGYRKANVGQIARAAGISKGAFYLFFPSKADAFAAVALEVEAELRRSLLERMEASFDDARHRLEALFRAQLDAFADHPFLWIIVDPAEAPGLFRDLSPEAAAEIGGADDTFFAGLVADWRRRGWISDIAPEVLAGLGRALYAVSLHRDLVGEDAYEGVVDELVAALAERLAPPE